MSVRVGIPRALLYYNFYPFWKTFLTELGAEVIVSPPTNRQILSDGVKYAVDEVCLPVKIFFGHVISLKDKVDYLFIPRIASIEKKFFICAKFWGLPDVIRNSLEDIPPLLTTDINSNRRSLYRSMWQLGRRLRANLFKIHTAYRKARGIQEKFLQSRQQIRSPAEFLALLEGEKVNPLTSILSPKGRGDNKKIYSDINVTIRKSSSYSTSRLGSSNGVNPATNSKIGLIGRPYNVYDDYLNMDIVARLEEMGASVVTPEMLSPTLLYEETKRLSRKNYWTYGKDMLGAARYLARERVDGLIFLVSFNCGPDSLLTELAIRKIEDKIPVLLLIFDEERAEAGMMTRIESFMEIVKKRKK